MDGRGRPRNCPAYTADVLEDVDSSWNPKMSQRYGSGFIVICLCVAAVAVVVGVDVAVLLCLPVFHKRVFEFGIDAAAA